MNSLGLMSMLIAALPPDVSSSRRAMESVMPRLYIPKGHNRSSDYRKGCVEAGPIPPKSARQLKKEEKYQKLGLTNNLSVTPKKVEVMKPAEPVQIECFDVRAYPERVKQTETSQSDLVSSLPTSPTMK